MKILHIGYTDGGGGAGIAMLRLHNALLEQRVDSSVLVIKKTSTSKTVFEFKSSKIQLGILYFANLFYRIIFKYLATSPYRITKSINLFGNGLLQVINNHEADIIHLHWIGNDTLTIKEIASIKKTLVWTSHDLWPILGSEHSNPSGSSRFINGYSTNNRTCGYRGIDLERLIWKQKQRAWKRLNATIVTLSSWERRQFQRSQIFKNKSLVIIGNPLDTSFWTPGDKLSARQKMDLPETGRLILFSGINALQDSNKGYSLLKSALTMLEHDKFSLVVLGAIGSDLPETQFPVIMFPVLHDMQLIRELYRACDLIISASFEETFGMAVAEALLCGTPAVAYSNTGCVDMIIHQKNGFLVDNYDSESFKIGIEYCLNNLNELEKEEYREVLVSKYSTGVIACQYNDLYHGLKK